jgi:hypothetical protein
MAFSTVSDPRSNPNDQIAYIAKVLGRAKERTAVFVAIHTGKRNIKSATEIAKSTKLKRKRVLEEGIKLVHKQIVKQHRLADGDIGYERDAFSYGHKAKIVALASSPTKLDKFPTKYTVKIAPVKFSVPVAKSAIRTAIITVDGIASFAKVKKIRSGAPLSGMSETQFKHGVQRVIGEKGTFKDWGGETSDLWTTRVRLGGKRVAAAFAFKGPGKKGLLTPGGMGKNGDQVLRLFHEDADVFLVQYVGQIAPTVLQEMAPFAQMKSVATGRKIYYGLIDGNDSARLVAAYPKAFMTGGRKKKR